MRPRQLAQEPGLVRTSTRTLLVTTTDVTLYEARRVHNKMAGDGARIDTVMVRDSSAGSSIAWRAVEESMEEERPIQVRSLQYLRRQRRLPGSACPPSLPSFCVAIRRDLHAQPVGEGEQRRELRS